MTIKKIIQELLNKEGGYVNHPADHGGETNHGITKRTYSAYFNKRPEDVTSKDMKDITQELAEKIFYTLYYIRPKINLLPEIIQPLMLDMAVNHGPHTSVQMLQKNLAFMGFTVGKWDGVCGEKTISASTRCTEKHHDELINHLIDSRVSFYHDIIDNDPSQKVFEKGWLARAESFRPEVTV